MEKENQFEESIIGREEEKETLLRCLHSKSPEFVALYGRRRIGKTFLVRKFFKDKFSFYATGVNSKTKRSKLEVFKEALQNYGDKDKNTPKTWFDAFSRLKALLEDKECYKDPDTGKKVVFLDELPWMDSPRSEFKTALDYFWNVFGSAQDDLLLIVCGSATSWIINNIVKDTGGFYNRLTNQIHLFPFHLKECQKLAKRKGLDYDEMTLLKAYMVFGGVPYYWNLLSPSKSLDQEIDGLCFQENGVLHYEFQNLFRSLFSSKGNHREIIEVLFKKAAGYTRKELIEKGVSDGKGLTKSLEELEECGFIRKFNLPNKTSGAYYQVIDSFCRFALTFFEKKKLSSWLAYIDTPSYYSWQGNAFELLCLNHVKEIKNALGISGVETKEYSFRSKESNPGAQIDLVIERKDQVINLCEMKYSLLPYVIDKEYMYNLENKKQVFLKESKTKCALRLTLISPNGLQENQYSNEIRNVITAKDFFRSW